MRKAASYYVRIEKREREKKNKRTKSYVPILSLMQEINLITNWRVPSLRKKELPIEIDEQNEFTMRFE